jgi:hypothetical protein
LETGSSKGCGKWNEKEPSRGMTAESMKNFELWTESLAATGSKATKGKQEICDGCRSEIVDEEA